MHHKSMIISALLSLFFFMATPCMAGVHDTFGIGAKATALGGAFTAYADDFSAIHYNPAGLTQIKGTSLNVGLQVADIDYKQRVGQRETTFGTDPLSGTSSRNNSDLLAIPQIGFTYSPDGARWTFGYGVYVPVGAHIWYNSHTSNNRYGGAELYNDRIIYASPTLAYQLLDNLSVGLSIGMGYTDEGGHIKLRVPGIEHYVDQFLTSQGLAPFNLPSGTGYSTSFGSVAFDVDDKFTLSANVGVLWKPVDGISLGVTYRSEAHSRMRGHTTFKYSPEARGLITNLYGVLGIPGTVPDREIFDTSLGYVHPQALIVGTKVDITSKWSVMLDIEWKDWSVRKYESWVYNGEPTFLIL